MPVEIIRGDITKIKCDAIVNAANNTLLGGGGVDGCIHRSAGPELLAECRTLGGCETGNAKITKGYNLPCRYVIHTVGPVWHGGGNNEEKLLSSCYRSSLALAEKHKCETVAFPVISSGIYGYPKAEAFKVAADTIMSFLEEAGSDMLVYIVIYNNEKLSLADARLSRISEIIEAECNCLYNMPKCADADYNLSDCMSAPIADGSIEFSVRGHSSLENKLKNLDESFSEALLRLIGESGMTDAQCYNRANVDRRLFSKIRSNADYKPSKETVIAFAVALRLSMSETEALLKKAGYSLSGSKTFDVIIEYCISEGIYDIMDINTLLFNHDQKLLGGIG